MNGRVLDIITMAPVPFAYLTAERDGQSHVAQANGNGAWTYAFLPGDVVKVESVGYFPLTTTYATLLADGGEVFLEELIAELDPVEVTADRPRSWGWLLLLALAVVASD